MTDWKPQLVALDIDGTLLRWEAGTGASQGQVTAPVREAVQRAVAAGAHVVLASGRSAHSMTPIAEQLGLTGADEEKLWIVASNGAVIFRYPPFELVHEETFDAAPAVAAVLAAHPAALVAVEDRGVGYRANKPFPDGELNGTITLTDVEHLVASPVSRVIIRDPHATVEEFVVLASQLGLESTDYVIGWTAWMDLSAVGVSKASGLAKVAAELGVDTLDTLAIGDGRNDLEMFAWAGHSVAMGQSILEVRAAADEVTASVDDDGAAVALDRWFR